MQMQANKRKHETARTLARVRAIVIVGAASATSLLLALAPRSVQPSVTAWTDLFAGGSIDDVAAAIAWAAAALLATWWWLMVLCAGLADLPGTAGSLAGSVARVVTPALLRPALGLTVGSVVTVTAIGAPSALAIDLSARPTSVAAAAVTASPTPGRPTAIGTRMPTRAGLPSLERPFDPAPVDPARVDPAQAPNADASKPRSSAASASPAAGAPAADEVVVRPGDTLWAITAASLAPDASKTAVATSWPRWYAANRAVIGSNPDVIHPGQVLHPPN